MANSTESEKYEVLEKIGLYNPDMMLGVEVVNCSSGHGSFGIIRKVRRHSDGLVSNP